jgi:hypothetical protein
VAFVGLAYGEVDLDLAFLEVVSFLGEAFQGEAYLYPSFQVGALVVSCQGDLLMRMDMKCYVEELQISFTEIQRKNYLKIWIASCQL